MIIVIIGYNSDNNLKQKHVGFKASSRKLVSY